MEPIKDEVHNWMAKDVYTVGPEDLLLDVADNLNERNFGAAIVVENEAVIGIITERDFLKQIRVISKNPDLKVRELMTTNIQTINYDDKLENAGLIMCENHFRHLPVVEGEVLVGILSTKDISRANNHKHISKIKNLEVVKKMAVTLGHEINNPLTVISFTLQRIQRDLKAPKTAAALEHCDRIKDVVNKISSLEDLVETEYTSSGGSVMYDIHSRSN